MTHPAGKIGGKPFCQEYTVATIVDSLTQVYFAKNIDNLLVQLTGLTSNDIRTRISYSIYHITILCSIFYFNKLMTYLMYPPGKTINFFRCLHPIDIKSVSSINFDSLIIRVIALSNRFYLRSK